MATSVVSAPRAPWGVLALAAVAPAALALAGCGRNQGDYPPGFAPDGVASTTTFLSLAVDSLERPDGSVGPGVTVTVLDNTVTDGFVLYRQTDTESAFREILTFPLPFERSFNSGYRLFTAVDWDLQENRGASYRARGTVHGAESKLSPLSTTATLPAASIDALLPADFAMVCPVDTANTDSLATLSWEAVPNAQQYVVRIQRTDGKPFVVVVTPPDGSTSYTLESGLGLIVHEIPLTRSYFFWAVTALNANGLVVGETSQAQIFFVNPDAATPCP
jgi:hypothetical protein